MGSEDKEKVLLIKLPLIESSMGNFRTIYNTHTHLENDVPNNTDVPNQPI